MFSICDSVSILGAPDDMVTNTRKVFYSSAPDKDNGVFL